MKISLFEYRRRKAQAALNKAEAQQQVLDYLVQLGFLHRYAEDVAEAGQDFRTPGDLNADEFVAVNELLAKVRTCEVEGYKVEQETIII